MSDMPWSKFFWSDWEADQGLRLCSLAAQGIWMRMLCVCARHEPKGYLAINGNPLGLDAIARLAGVAESEAGNLVDELERNGVFSRDRKGRIYSRRMVRDEKRSQEGRKHKKRGLKEAAEKHNENPPPSREPPRGAFPQKPEARSQIEEEAKASLFDDGPKSPSFSDFWAAWPLSKNAKKNAEAAFKKLSAEDKTAATECAAAWADDWLRRHPHANHIHPATYLNARRWTDEGQPTLTIIHGSSNDRQSPQQNRQSAADDRFGRVADAAIRNRAPSSADFGFR